MTAADAKAVRSWSARLRGFRRLIVVLAILVVAAVALFGGKLPPADFVELAKWLALSFTGSDGVEKVAGAWAAKSKIKAAAAKGGDDGAE